VLRQLDSTFRKPLQTNLIPYPSENDLVNVPVQTVKAISGLEMYEACASLDEMTTKVVRHLQTFCVCPFWACEDDLLEFTYKVLRAAVEFKLFGSATQPPHWLPWRTVCMNGPTVVWYAHMHYKEDVTRLFEHFDLLLGMADYAIAVSCCEPAPGNGKGWMPFGPITTEEMSEMHTIGVPFIQSQKSLNPWGF